VCDAGRVTQDASPRLHVVTGNHVIDHQLAEPAPAEPGGVWADLGRRAEALDRVTATAPAGSGRPRLVGMVAVGAGLTVVLALLGRQAWQLPHRDAGGVSDIPQSLLTFLLLCAAVCVWTAGRVVQPAATLRSPAAVHLWWALVAGAALVSVAADLSLASYAGSGERPADLLVRCAIPLVPAVLAGVLAREDGRPARIRAALGTGLVTVPLGALGWALLSEAARSTASLSDVLALTGLAAGAPLALAVAFVAADRRRRAPSEA
jgi:hypothetical protein